MPSGRAAENIPRIGISVQSSPTLDDPLRWVSAKAVDADHDERDAECQHTSPYDRWASCARGDACEPVLE